MKFYVWLQIMITETVEQEDLKTKIRKTNTVKLQNKKKFKGM